MTPQGALSHYLVSTSPKSLGPALFQTLHFSFCSPNTGQVEVQVSTVPLLWPVHQPSPAHRRLPLMAWLLRFLSSLSTQPLSFL